MLKSIIRDKKIITIPNALSVFRIAIIPAIVYYINKQYQLAFFYLLLSGVTDVLDGWIARKFHMTSDLGIVLDPVADKLTQGSMEGFATKTDEVIASVFAYREGRHGSQKWVNRAAFSEATDLFRFRTIPGLNVSTAHVILCGDDRFEITSVEDVKGRGMYIEVLAKKVTPDGKSEDRDAK